MALTKVQQPLLPQDVIFATNWVLTTGISLTGTGTTIIQPVSANNPVKFTFTPTTQTSAFALTGITPSTNPSNYRVDINGVLQEPGVDYILSGSNIIFTTPVSASEKVVVVANTIIASFDIATAYADIPYKFTFTPTIPTSAFTLSGLNLSTNINSYRVDIDGVLQEPGTDFNLSGTDLVFSAPVSAGEKVVVIGNNVVGTFDPSFSPVLATGTTTARTLQNRFADIINVKDFGAVGDGVTDDTAAIQAAQAVAGNKLIYLPEGTYKVTQYLTLRGFGPGRMLETAARLSELAPILPVGATSRADEYAHLATGGIAVGAAGESGQGTLLKCGPNPAWSAWSPTKEGSAMEMTLSPRGYFGEAEAQSGTNKLILTFTVFPPIANLIKPNDIIGFGSSIYRVDSLVFSGANISEINVKTFAGGVVSFASTFKEIARWAYIIGDVRVNISGSTATRIGGDSFAINSGPIADSSIIYNGTQYPLATRNENVVTVTGLSATVNNVWVTYKLRVDHFNILRLQGLYGTGEETLAIVGGLDGSWMMSTQFAQMGKYRNLQIGLGNNADKQADISPLIIHPDTRISIGNQSPQSQPAGFGSLTVGRSVSAAQGGASTTAEVVRIQSDFANSGYRALTIDFKNNFEGPVLQGWNTTNRSGPTSIYINPDGGSTMLSVPGTFASPQTFNATIVGTDFYPHIDNTFTCGTSSNKWSAVWAQNGTIQTSDIRDKVNITDSILGLNFINSLRPVSYNWLEGGTQPTETETEIVVEEPVYEQREVQKVVYENTDNKVIEKVITQIENVPVYDNKPVFSENMEPLYGDDGKQITRRVHRTQLVTKNQKDIVYTPISGERTHYGLIAQEVKAALPAGVDFGGWVLTDKNNPNSQQSLRYDQFIAPLVKAVQELSTELKELKQTLNIET